MFRDLSMPIMGFTMDDPYDMSEGLDSSTNFFVEHPHWTLEGMG
jgi:hypothetical protein